jgi:hypothetical protein
MKMLPDATPEIPAWAHRTGMLALGDAHRPDEAQAMADRSLFSERIARYCWAYDERRREALADCFTQDAIWEGNVLGQVAIGPFVGREKIVTWLTEFWPYQHVQRRHMILNTIVEKQSPGRRQLSAIFCSCLQMARRSSWRALAFIRLNIDWREWCGVLESSVPVLTRCSGRETCTR